MKSSIILLLCLALTPAITLAGPASESSPASSTVGSGLATAPRKSDEAAGRLWIAVNLPNIPKATWVSDDMAATFAHTVATALRAQGFKGKIGILRPEDSAPSRAPVLFVRLTSWTAKEGFAGCTFTASLRTSEGDRDLGFFPATT